MHSLRGLTQLKTNLLYNSGSNSDLTSAIPTPGAPLTSNGLAIPDAAADFIEATQKERQAKFKASSERRRSRLGTTQFLVKRESIQQITRMQIVRAGIIGHATLTNGKVHSINLV